MLYFTKDLIANSRPIAARWGEVASSWDFWNQNDAHIRSFEGVTNAAAVIPRDAWLDLQGPTTRVRRADEGAVWMRKLLARPKIVDIGKIVHMNRVSSDAGTVQRSISGQTPVLMDKVNYDYRTNLVPMFHTAYGRSWREQASFMTERFDALADDNEAHQAKINRDMALYTLNGDATIVFQGTPGYGIRTHPLSKSINVGPSGNNINLTSATPDAMDTFFNGPFGAILDASYVNEGVDLFISPEIARGWDRTYSGSAGFKDGNIRQFLLTNRRINSIEVSFELTGNEFFWYVDNPNYINLLTAMPVTTTAIPRDRPRADYNFDVAAAMGVEIRADYNGRGAVGYSVST